MAFYACEMRMSNEELTQEIKQSMIEHFAKNDDVADIKLVDLKLVHKGGNEKNCKLAYDWWASNKSKWSSIKKVWDNIYKKEKNITLKKKLNCKKLYEYLLFSSDFENFNEQNELINNFIVNLK